MPVTLAALKPIVPCEDLPAGRPPPALRAAAKTGPAPPSNEAHPAGVKRT